MSLKLKTFDKQDTFGKQKVFFCAHPKDYIYFEEITDEILKIQNCAIFYKENPSEQVNLDDLNEMSLFIIPVTSNFLYLENNARNLEFKYAVEHHIPVLPLQQEEGIEKEFNKQCGNLQMLNKNQNDDTAIKYEDKLKQFILSVLVGDEERTKIQEAFDAYIFLSYRKKDRKYAQDLMKAIHNCDKCRDLAIWYDEFLIPGENFNSNIEEMMNKSKIFSLVVTPNLLEDGNYVQTVEYKNAKKSNIVIIPTEMKETDKDKLKDMYEDIPECSKSTDNSLNEALVKACQEMAIVENDTDTEHNYLIGLAYLGGVDVEKDYNRAFKIIDECAKQDYLPAMEKVAQMYEKGLGVERNYDTAIEWEEKILSIIKNQYNADPTEDNFIALEKILRQLGDKYKTLRKLTEAQNYFLEESNLCKEWYEKTNKKYIKKKLAISYERLADIFSMQSDLENSKKYYLASFEIIEEFAKEENTENSKRNLAISYLNLGDNLKLNSNFEESETYILKGVEIFEQIVKDNQSTASLRDLSNSYYKLGCVFNFDKKYSEAEKFFLKSIQILEEILKENDDYYLKNSLALNYEELGNTYFSLGKASPSRDNYIKSIEINEQLVKDLDTPTSKINLSIVYEKLGRLYKLCRKLNEAKNLYYRALKIRLDLLEYNFSDEICRLIIVGYFGLGGVLMVENDFSSAKNLYFNAVQICEKMVSLDNTNLANLDLLAASYYTYGTTDHNNYEYEYIDKAKEIYQYLVEVCPNNKRYNDYYRLIEGFYKQNK